MPPEKIVYPHDDSNSCVTKSEYSKTPITPVIVLAGFLQKTLLFFIYLLFIVTANGQQKKMDSLLQIHRSYAPRDSLKIVQYRNIYRQYILMQKDDEAMPYVDSIAALSERIKQYTALVDIYEKAGRLHHGKSKYFEALSYYQQAYDAAKKYKELPAEAGILINIGALYLDIKDYAKSLEAHEKAIILNEKVGNKLNVGSCYMNIALIYLDLDQIVRSFPYLNKALQAFETNVNGIRGIAVASQALATAYTKASSAELQEIGISELQRYSLALAALNKALPIAFKVDDLPMASTIYADMADIHEKLGDREAVRVSYKNMLEADKKHTTGFAIAGNLVRIGMHYLRSKERATGFFYLHAATQLAERYNSLATLRTSYEQLSRFHEEENSFDSSLFYYKKFIVVRDAIYGAEKEKEITIKQLTLDFHLKERDYNYSKQLVDNQLKEQVLLAERRKNALELAEKEKSVQRLLFLQQQVKLENETRFQAAAFQRQKDKSDYNQALAKEQIDNQKLEIRFNKYLNLFFLISVIVLLAVGTIIFSSQRKTKKLNHIISEQKNSLQELVHVKDQLLGTISHDMRTPINSLMAFTHLLDSQEISQDKLKMYTSQLKNTLGYTQELLDNLLKWATTQMKGFMPVPVSLNLAEIVDQILSSFSDSIAQKQIVIENNIHHQTLVFADREMLLCVIRNLISNAIKFSHAHKTVQISVTNENIYKVLCIKDDGIGISKEKLMIMNDSSAQMVNSSRGTSQEKGNGLGVLLCKSFVELMNGKLFFYSEQGKGTEAKVSLPSV